MRAVDHAMLKTLIIVMLLLLASGCMNITLQVQPEQPDAKAVLTGSDCVPILFGFAFGTATVEGARYKTTSPGEWVGKPIRTIRTVRISYEYYLIAGSWCVEVTGE